MTRRRTPHANRGKAWEEILEFHHQRVQARGLGVVFRTPPPVKLLARLHGGQWRAVLTQEGPPDYLGLLRGPKGPIPVAMEAKDCAGDRWSMKELKPHQAAALQWWTDLGGLGVVALRHRSRGWMIPWSQLGPHWSRWRATNVAGTKAPRGSASLGLGDLQVLGERWEVGDGYLEAIFRLTV